MDSFSKEVAWFYSNVESCLWIVTPSVSYWTKGGGGGDSVCLHISPPDSELFFPFPIFLTSLVRSPFQLDMAKLAFLSYLALNSFFLSCNKHILALITVKRKFQYNLRVHTLTLKLQKLQIPWLNRILTPLGPWERWVPKVAAPPCTPQGHISQAM